MHPPTLSIYYHVVLTLHASRYAHTVDGLIIRPLLFNLYRSYIMQAFWTALNQFFSMLTLLFSAGEKVAGTLNNVAGVGEMKSRTYLDEAAHDQEVAIEEFAFARDKRRNELAVKRQALAAPAAVTP